MNNQTSKKIAKIVNVTAKAVNKRKPRRKARGRAIGLSRNPGSRSDVSLSLTRGQFTATSPQLYWEFVRASTPGGLRVRGREMLGSVVAPGAIAGLFTLLNIGSSGSNPPLNPATFPRLSQISLAFAQFIFYKIDLLFQSNQPTTTAGEVLVAFDYDAKSNSPTSSLGIMRNVSSTMANIYSDCSCQALSTLS
jgi:hypothetical protein